MSPSVPLRAAEVMDRRRQLVEGVADLDLDAAVLFLPAYVAYLSGFEFVATERPIVGVILGDGEMVLVVPFLEGDHARESAAVDEVVTYEEFPGPRHPMATLAEVLAGRNLRGPRRRLGVDVDGYPPLWGYTGPALSEVTGARVFPVSRAVDQVMMLKSAYEIACLRRSAHWAGRAHRLLQAYTRVGLRETEVASRASTDATSELVAAESGYSAGGLSPGARAGYRGQIGRRGALPHSLGTDVAFAAGDTLVTGATAPMWGYVSELERTMFIGEPGAKQLDLFGHMLALQDLCLAEVRPGVLASVVDEAMRDYFEANGLWPLWRHHVGHGIGRRYHEAPFLDRGDDTELAAGMVLTVEPGLYDPEWGGFRHSDTVLVTPGGAELLTDYPRQIEDLVIAVD